MGLDKKDFFGKSDPFYELGKQNPDGTFTTVYRSETIEGTLSPRWRQHEINVKRLCGGQAEQPILVGFEGIRLKNMRLDCFCEAGVMKYSFYLNFFCSVRAPGE